MHSTSSLLGELPAAAARLWPDAVAVTFEERNTTFAEQSAAIDRAARALLARGIGKGDAVGLWITNRPEMITSFFAVAKIGAIAVPLNTRYRRDDLGFVVRHAECKLLVFVDRSGPVDYAAMVEAMLPGTRDGAFVASPEFPRLEGIVVISGDGDGGDGGDGGGGRGGAASWDRFLAGADAIPVSELERAAAAVKVDDPALVIFTSGTTGNPKGVVHDHHCVRHIRDRALLWPLRAGDTTINYLPMFHVYALGEIMVSSMIVGTRQVVMDTFDPERALRLIEKERVNGLHGFETHWTDLMRAHDRVKTDLSSVTFGTFPAGQESSSATARQVNERICRTVTGFGLSESWGWICCSSLEDTVEQCCQTSGKPLPGIQIRIVDPLTGEERPRGAIGEVLVGGYSLMRGYFREPEATARTVDEDGWLHTGDTGLLREDGFLQFLGRYKEMLKVGGENVSPTGVELELLRLVPEIEQVAVVGYPDARLSEVPVAYVVVKPGMTCDAALVAERCKGRIASFKIPRHVLVVPSLPATASGKVQRVLLKTQVLNDLPRS